MSIIQENDIQEMSKTLRPCPFCGSNHINLGNRPNLKRIGSISEVIYEFNYFVRCMKCGCELQGDNNLTEVVEKWNIRHPEEDTTFNQKTTEETAEEKVNKLTDKVNEVINRVNELTKSNNTLQKQIITLSRVTNIDLQRYK